MENWEIEKEFPIINEVFSEVYNRGIKNEKESTIITSKEEGIKSSSLDSSQKKRTRFSSLTGKEQEIDLDEKEQTAHWKRKGIPEWKHSIEETDSLIDDKVVYGLEDKIESNSTHNLLSLYELTQQRDESLYEKSCCSSDVIQAWTQISHYVRGSLRKGTGVIIPGLCTFTVAITKRNSVERDYFVLRRKPVLSLSKTLVNRYKLIDTSERTFGLRAPACMLNLTQIGKAAKISRSAVEGIVTEVLKTFARALVGNKPIEFPFPLIGKLQVRNKRAVMKFYAEFYKTMKYDYNQEAFTRLVLKRRSTIKSMEEYGEKLHSVLGRKGSAFSTISEDEEEDDDILPGQMTPLNIHVPTDNFRSVFHLREVRSVTELITVTADELKRIDCLEVTCLEPVEPYEVPSVPKFPCETMFTPPKFDWCPSKNEADETEHDETVLQNPPMGEEDGEDSKMESYIANWIQHARLAPSTPSTSGHKTENEGEYLPEEDYIPKVNDRHCTSYGGEDCGETVQEDTICAAPPPTLKEFSELEFDLELQPPCHHNYRPEPLYNPGISGNYEIDMLLPHKFHMKNFLEIHHYELCQKMLGIATVKKHFQGNVTSGQDPTRKFYF